ncbi:MAG: hypothetical protein ACO3KY_04430 [Lysobacterales bacterium]
MMAEQGLPTRWNRRKRDIAVALWVAFLSASFGTFVLFGLIDPGEIESALMAQWDFSRKLAYSLGFAFLFMISAIAAALTVFMIRTGPQRGHASGQGRRPPPEIRDPSENNPDLDLDDLK